MLSKLPLAFVYTETKCSLYTLFVMSRLRPKASATMYSAIFFFSFRLFNSRVTTVNHLLNSISLCLIFPHTSHVLFHYIHKSSLCSSSRPPAWQFQRQHPSTNILYPSMSMSKSSQAGLSDFISKTSDKCSPSTSF